MGMWWMHDTTSGGAAVASMANGFAYPDYASFDEPTLIARLDANIDSFMSKLSTALEPRRRAWASVVSYVKETIADIWSEADVELYGSCYTGLELPSSDVDVVVTGIDGKHYSYGVAPSEPYSAEETVGHLRRLASVLSGAPWVRSMKVIETASVPVIKIVADPNCGARVEAPEKSSKVTASNSSSAPDPNALSPSPQTVEENGPAGCFSWVGIGAGCDSVPLDISFASPLHGGVASSKWVRQYVQDGKYHFSQSATLVLKEVLCQRGLNQPWSGGLSSYSLINMMITVLQEVEKQRVQDRKLEERAISMRDKDQSDDGSANSGNHADDPSSCFEQMTSFEDLGVSETDLSSEDLSDVTPGLCLLRFLEFYGRAFDSSHFGISVGRGPLRNPFLVDHPVDPHTGLPAVTSALTIEDPLDMNRNVAHSCFGFPQVQWLFANCLSALELRGPEMMRRDSDANLLQLLMYL
jgi:DNA polymerase sigma